MTDAAARRLVVLNIIETVVTAALGAVVAGAVWSLIDLAVPAAIIGGANGAIAGIRRIYHWRSPKGWLALGLDSTWALITTAAALVAHAVAGAQRSPDNYVAELSERRNRHVYQRGYTLRRGFMLTVGNVVNGAGPLARTDRHRQQVVTRHEDVHVWQARWFGPIFPGVYAAWYVLGVIVGSMLWLVRRPAVKLSRVIDTWSYYRNPFEWWAYSREGRWPPPGAVQRFAWRNPLVRGFGDR